MSHFHPDKEYTFSSMILYGFQREDGMVKVNAYLLNDENGWEAILEMPTLIFEKELISSFEQWPDDLKNANDIFFPDFFPDPPMWESGNLTWKFKKSILETDEELGDEVIYFFQYLK